MNTGFQVYLDTFYFEITNECNFKCSFCYNSSGSSKENILFMDFNDFVHVTGILKKHGYSKFVISGGEPLLHPNIWDILEYLKEHNFHITLITNGYLVDNELIQFFVENKEYVLQINIDGINQKTHDTVRCEGSYEKNINTVYSLFKSGYKNGIIRMTIMKQNYQEIQDVYDFALKHNFTPKFMFVQSKGRANDTWEDLGLCIDEYEYVHEALSEKIKINPNMNFVLKNLLYIGKCTLLLESPILKPIVNVNFDVFPCTLLNNKLGNLIVDDFNQVFTGNMKYLKDKLINKHKLYVSTLCKDCICKSYCIKECPATMADSQKKIPICNWIEMRIKNTLFKKSK